MTIYNWLIVIFWLVFVGYWVVSVVAMFQIPALRQAIFPHNSMVLFLGTILCGLGNSFCGGDHNVCGSRPHRRKIYDAVVPAAVPGIQKAH